MSGLGLGVVTALSGRQEVVVRHDGRRYYQEYIWGVPAAPVSVNEEATRSGTLTRFLPNRQSLHGDLCYRLLDHWSSELA